MKDKLEKIVKDYFNQSDYYDYTIVMRSGMTLIEEYFLENKIKMSNEFNKKNVVTIDNPYGHWIKDDKNPIKQYLHFPKELAVKIVMFGKMP